MSQMGGREVLYCPNWCGTLLDFLLYAEEFSYRSIVGIGHNPPSSMGCWWDLHIK